MRSILTILFALTLPAWVSAEERHAALQGSNDGAIVLRVLSNKPELVSIYFYKAWTEVSLDREADSAGPSAHFSIKPIVDGSTTRTAVFAASLPPGHYQLKKFFKQGAWLDVNENFSRFDVEAGTLTDLGVVVESASPTAANKDLLSHKLTGDAEETKVLVRELAPELQPLLDKPMLGWRADSVPASMAEADRYAIQHSVGLLSHQETGEGDLIFASHDGVVKHWDPQHGWTTYDVGQRSGIGSVLVMTNGDWMVGGELGLLKLSSDRGISWHSLRGGIPYGITVDLQEWNGQIVATTLRGNEVRIYTAPLRSDEWKLRATYTSSVSRFLDHPGTRPQSYLHEDKLVTLVPGRSVAVLDLKDGTVEQNDAPGAVGVFHMKKDGTLYVSASVVVALSYDSHDYGKTWVSSAESRNRRYPAYRDANHGISVHRPPFSKVELIYTEDGGANWLPSQSVPEGVADEFWSHDGKAAYAVTAPGMLLQSLDDGKSWRLLQ